MKRCAKCRETKPAADFYTHKVNKDGLNSYCKACQKLAKQQWRANDPDYYRRRYQENAERLREENRAQYRTRKTERDAATHRWRAKNPEKVREHKRVRNVRLRDGQRGDLTADSWQTIIDYFDARCAYCDAPLEEITQDHILPISKGGVHGYDNVVPACRSCNARKGNRSLLVFILAMSAKKG